MVLARDLTVPTHCGQQLYQSHIHQHLIPMVLSSSLPSVYIPNMRYDEIYNLLLFPVGSILYDLLT